MEGTVDWDTVAWNCSTGNCLFNFNERTSSKSSNGNKWTRRGFPTVSSPLPSNYYSSRFPCRRVLATISKSRMWTPAKESFPPTHCQSHGARQRVGSAWMDFIHRHRSKENGDSFGWLPLDTLIVNISVLNPSGRHATQLRQNTHDSTCKARCTWLKSSNELEELRRKHKQLQKTTRRAARRALSQPFCRSIGGFEWRPTPPAST